MLWMNLCVLTILSLYSCECKIVAPKCWEPLGMEDGRIGDSQIRASSSYSYESVGPSAARLNSEKGGGAWCPKNLITEKMKTPEFLEIDLEYNYVITAIVTQGRFANGQGAEFAEFYIVQYWREGMDAFLDYIDDGGEKVLEANTNTFAKVETKLESTIVASKIRIIPFSKHARTICLRIELKGCSTYNLDSQTKFDTKYGLEDGEIDVDIKDIKEVQTNTVDDTFLESQYIGVAVGVLVTVILILIIAIICILYKNYLSPNPPVISYSNPGTLGKKNYNCEYELWTGQDIVYVVERNRALALTPSSSEDNYTDSSLEYSSPLLNSHFRKEPTRSRIQSGPSLREAKNSGYLSPRDSNLIKLHPEASHSVHPFLREQNTPTGHRPISQEPTHGILKNGSVRDRQKSSPTVNWETFFPSPSTGTTWLPRQPLRRISRSPCRI